MAEWGEGKPVIGFAGEYDALNNLSQKNQARKEPLVEGEMGHGCGHNLLGTGCLAGAVGVKEWLAATGTTGTVRYYGCPSEENNYGKTFMARAGAFDDLDALSISIPPVTTMPTRAARSASTIFVFAFMDVLPMPAPPRTWGVQRWMRLS